MTEKKSDFKLLAVNRCVTRDSKNKIYRMRWEPEGTKMWVHKADGGYLFSKTEPSDTEVTVRETLHSPIYRYIAVSGIIAEEGYISTFLTPEGDYFAAPSTEDEVSRHAMKTSGPLPESGHVRKATCSVTLTRDDFNTLWTTPQILMRVVMTDEKLFIEAHGISAGEAEGYPDFDEAVSAAGGHEALWTAKTELVFKRAYIRKYYMRLPVPIEFIRRAGSNENDVYKVWFKDGGTMVVEAKPLHCDICGREINRYYDVADFVCVCGDCRRRADGLTAGNKSRIRGLSKEGRRELMAKMDTLIRKMEKEVQYE